MTSELSRSVLSSAREVSAPNGIRHSIIIITYRRDDCLQETLALVKAAVGSRPDVEMVLVDNNADGKNRASMLDGFTNKIYVSTEINLGVGGGRNKGIESAQGEFLTFLDDDALIQNPDFLDIIEENFLSDPEVGIVAGKVVNFYTRKVLRREFPHTNKRLDQNCKFFTHRFIGAAHSIRADMFRTLGLYDQEFFYGAEEFDFSYRAINSGWRIIYDPGLWVYHKKEASGRLAPLSAIEREFINKLRVSYLHLPLHLLILNALAWTGFTAIRSRGRANFPRILREFSHWRKANSHLRRPLDPAARAYVRSCGAALWK